MDYKYNELHDTILEVQTTNKFILKRLNNVLQNSPTSTCPCESATHLQTCLSEITILSAKLDQLEDTEKQTEALLNNALDQLKNLQDLYQRLKQSVKADHDNTDPDSVTVDQYEVTEDSVASDENGDDSNVDLPRDTEPHGVYDNNKTYNTDEVAHVKALTTLEPGIDENDDCSSNVECETETIAEIEFDIPVSLDNTGAPVDDITAITDDTSAQVNDTTTRKDDKIEAESDAIEISSHTDNAEINNREGTSAVGIVERNDTTIENTETTYTSDNTETEDSASNENDGIQLGTELPDTSENNGSKNRKCVTFNEKVIKKHVDVQAVDDDKSDDGDDGEGAVSDMIETVNLKDDSITSRGRLRRIHKLKSPGLRDLLSAELESDVSTATATPQVVSQTEVKLYDSHSDWEHLAAVELQTAWDAGLLTLTGVHSILLIDISESMEPAWSQVKQFFYDYISGLEMAAAQMNLSQEHVAIVTFGHETKVQMRLTNNFEALRQCFGRLKLGGPSPMFGGLSMAQSAVGSTDCQSFTINDIQELSKVVLITDGYPTHPMLYAGPDYSDQDGIDKGRQLMLQTFQDLGDTHYDLYVVPVGEADMDFLNKLTTAKCGKMLNYESGNQLSRRSYLMYTTQPLSLSLGHPHLIDGGTLTDADMADLIDIKRKKESNNPTYHEETGSSLLQIGSRVRRGPDWQYLDQDSGGPGTVVGHVAGGKKCYVNWDLNGTIDVYHCGDGDRHDVRVVDEQRYLQPGEYIAVGCIVRPGCCTPDFPDIPNIDLRGIVLRLTLEEEEIPKALVRWQNGRRGLYTYIIDDDPEIIVCYEDLLQSPPEQTTRKTTRNKNKNVR